jgi:hypothetical protein
MALAFGAVALALPALADREATHPITASAARGHVKRVVIDIPAGEFRVRNGATISVTGTVRRNYDGEKNRVRAQEAIDDMSAEIVIHGEEAVIQRKLGPNARGWVARNHASYDVTIEVPSGVDVDVRTRFGEMKLDGSFGNVDVDMNAGEIHMNTLRANVRDLSASVRVGEVHANLGDRSFASEGLFPHAAKFSNPDCVRGNVNLHVTAGEVHVTLTR